MPREPMSVTDRALEGEPVWADSGDSLNGDHDPPSALAAPVVAGATATLDAYPGAARASVPDARPTTRRRPRRGATVRPVPSPNGTATGVRPVSAPVPASPSLQPTDRQDPETNRGLERAPALDGTRRGRRVKRIVRRVDLWSVLKLSLVLYVCLYAAVLLAVAGLWAFINSAGLIDRFESFMKDVGFDKFQFHGPEMFRGVVAGGAILVLASALMTVIAAGLFNVVSELTGGLRLTVIEEDLAHPRPARTHRRDRRTQASAPAAGAPQ